jgi:ABC-type amino acid transport system permease subunit
VIRGTPLLIQLLFIFYGLPNIGLRLSPFALVSALTMVELTGAYNRLATETFDYFGTGLLVAFLYLLLGLPFARLARSMEERLGKGRSNPMAIRLGFGRREVRGHGAH